MKKSITLLAVLLACLLGACRGATSVGPGPGAAMPDPANRLQADHAPTPFSAAQIRETCGPTSRIRMRESQRGREPHIVVFSFENGDEEGVQFRSHAEDLTGKQLGDAVERRVAWDVLQSHASFPAIETRVSDERLDTELGSFACWRYDVEAEKQGRKIRRVFWFAKELPGPPLRLVAYLDGEQVSVLEIVGHSGLAK